MYCSRCHGPCDAWKVRLFARTAAAMAEHQHPVLPAYHWVCEDCGDILEAELWEEVAP